MRITVAVSIFLITCLSVSLCHSQSEGGPQSIGGKYSQSWPENYGARNSQPVQSDLWTWGGAPKGSMIFNGRLLPDPYYFWKSLNFAGGWLGMAYVDQNTGNPVFAYLEPYTGRVLYFYIEPKTRKPVYLNSYPVVGNPYSGGVPRLYPYHYW